MRKGIILTTAILASIAAGFVTPANAIDTTTDFTLTAAGGLGISAPASADLGSAATNAGTLSGALGAVEVTDDRGLLAGAWTATAAASDFTTGTATADETIAASNVSYWSGAATGTSGVAVFVPGQLTVLNAVAIDVAKTAFSATGTVGNNSATWNPTIVVTIPSDAVVGDYTGTVTHSVA
ncbi:MAG TPA: hypothetical protein VM618_06230 [Acidimicrobiia bacterium]|nr:hypothetical protein [Acidimicrobiia bacterium]